MITKYCFKLSTAREKILKIVDHKEIMYYHTNFLNNHKKNTIRIFLKKKNYICQWKCKWSVPDY